MTAHAAVLERFRAALCGARTPHAWLLSGPVGVGKRVLLAAMAQTALCEHGRACGACHACRMFAAGTHPDCVRVERAEGARDLRVDQVREALARLALAPAEEGRRVLLMPEAEAMNAQAANALLKTLEEPPDGALLLLAATDPLRLPATIRSRCVLVPVPPPAEDEARAMLVREGVPEEEAARLLAGVPGRPLLALEARGWDEALAAWERLCAEPAQADVAGAEDWCRRHAGKVPAAFVAWASLRPWLARGRVPPAVGEALWALLRWPEEVRRLSLRPAFSLFARWLALRTAVRTETRG